MFGTRSQNQFLDLSGRHTFMSDFEYFLRSNIHHWTAMYNRETSSKLPRLEAWIRQIVSAVCSSARISADFSHFGGLYTFWQITQYNVAFAEHNHNHFWRISDKFYPPEFVRIADRLAGSERTSVNVHIYPCCSLSIWIISPSLAV